MFDFIDVHTHVPPREKWELFLQEMRDNRIVLALTSSLGVEGWPAYPAEEQIVAANNQARDFAEYSGGMVMWLAYINPQLDGAMEELRRCITMGCRGVKLWISLRDKVDGSLSKVLPVLKYAAEKEQPVLIHALHSSTLGHGSPGEISVKEIKELALKCPQVKILAAHAGGNWPASQGVLEELPNVSVDISGGMPSAGMAEALVEWLGAGRVLYGSDALGRSFYSQKAKVLFSELDDTVKRMLAWENAINFFHILPEEVSAARIKGGKLPPTPVFPSIPPRHILNSCLTDRSEMEDVFAFSDYPPFFSGGGRITASGFWGKSKLSSGKDVYSSSLLSQNAVFIKDMVKFSGVEALATIYPFFDNWEETLEAAAVQQGFREICVYPYLHNWQLNGSDARDFFKRCAELGLRVTVNVQVYDHRFFHPGFTPRPVREDELLSFIAEAPCNTYTILGASFSLIDAALGTKSSGDFFFEISRLLDTTGALRYIVEKYGWGQLVFGSERPVRNPFTNLYMLYSAVYPGNTEVFDGTP